MRSRRLQLVASATDAQLDTKFDKAGGEITGNVTVAGEAAFAGTVHIAGQIVADGGIVGFGTDLSYDAGSREVRSSTGTSAVLPLVAAHPGLLPAPPATGLEPTGKIFGETLQWAQPPGEPQFELRLKDVSKTSGPIAGSFADTGQQWTVSGAGAVPPLVPSYSEDEFGGYMQGNSGGVYVFANLGAEKCTRVRHRKRGSIATIAFLTTPGSLNNMIHVNIDQATGGVTPTYWNSGVVDGPTGSALSFRTHWTDPYPVSDPDQIRNYEVQVVGQHLVTYVDGVLTGVTSDPRIAKLVGSGFYVQLHGETHRIYEVEAWTDTSVPSSETNSPSLSVSHSRVVDTKLITANRARIGDIPTDFEIPASGTDFYVYDDNPTFRGGIVNALFRSSVTGAGTTLRVHNASGLGLDIIAGGEVATTFRHQGANRMVFPANVARVDFPAVMINIGGGSHDNSAQLHVNSTTKGFLPPRMTGAQAAAIASPAEGLMIYVTDTATAPFTTKGWYGYDGSAWKRLSLAA